jgi:hypothetical protein
VLFITQVVNEVQLTVKTAVGPLLPAGSVIVTDRVAGAPDRFHESVAAMVMV